MSLSYLFLLEARLADVAVRGGLVVGQEKRVHVSGQEAQYASDNGAHGLAVRVRNVNLRVEATQMHWKTQGKRTRLSVSMVCEGIVRTKQAEQVLGAKDIGEPRVRWHFLQEMTELHAFKSIKQMGSNQLFEQHS